MGSQHLFEADDWTRALGNDDHVRFMLSVNWAATPLGDIQKWSPVLRIMVCQMLRDSRPAILYWGTHKTAIYNEAFIGPAGKTHPRLMGIGMWEAYPEIENDIQPIFDLAAASKKAVDVVQIPLMVERSGYVEEAYFTGNFNPIPEVNGEVGGYYNALFEVTDQKLQERRAAMMRLIAQHGNQYTTKTIGSHIEECLLSDGFDIPMALLYQIDDDQEVSPDCRLTLRAKVGVPDDHPLCVLQGSLRSKDGVFPLLRHAQEQITTSAIGSEFDGLEWKGYGDACTSLAVLPLINGGRSYGYLVVGANPRRPIDDVHNRFMQDLCQQVSAAIATAVSQQQTLDRHLRLEQGLAESERQVRYMAQHASVAMVNISTDGEIIWANEIYWTMIGGPSKSPDSMVTPFHGAVLEADQEALSSGWKSMSRDTSLTLELRMLREFKPPEGEAVPTTMLLSATPYLENGSTKSFMCCMTDVSRLKWAESWQAHAAKEAELAKQRQIEFTDTVSHEIRNPLSAIFQLTESIVSSADASAGVASADFARIMADHLEAAKTILICARHQKRIVDDVLMLSKLDFTSSVLSPTPNKVQAMVDATIKMIGTTERVDLTCSADASPKTLAAETVMCDSLRVRQILINLATNAIKFTQHKQTRKVSITWGVTPYNPEELFPDLRWVPSKDDLVNPSTGSAWGTGERLHLYFSVSDTGTGMTQEALRRLFNRFEQVSPKTAIKYGGSGLGLFISEKLCRKQGGNIGVSSQIGKGSTFVFYIKTRRAPDDIAALPAPSDQQSGDLPYLIGDLNIQDTNSVNTFQNKTHILLVEDNLVNQRILQRQLTHAGCIVTVANHGVEALHQLKESSRWIENKGDGSHLDIVLMDCEMPVMDGLTCTRKIREFEAHGVLSRRIPIIAVTANARKEQLQHALSAGMDDVVTKPFVISDLIRVIRRIS